MNTRIHYLYRDADNYKVQNECVVLGEMTEKQEQRIIACLDEKEYFVPSRVGMPERKFDTETDSDHPWFEWERIEETGQKPTLEITAEELVKREFGADGPNMAWFADITYGKTRQGWLHLALGYMGPAEFEEANWPEGEGCPKAS